MKYQPKGFTAMKNGLVHKVGIWKDALSELKNPKPDYYFKIDPPAKVEAGKEYIIVADKKTKTAIVQPKGMRG